MTTPNEMEIANGQAYAQRFAERVQNLDVEARRALGAEVADMIAEAREKRDRQWMRGLECLAGHYQRMLRESGVDGEVVAVADVPLGAFASAMMTGADERDEEYVRDAVRAALVDRGHGSNWPAGKVPADAIATGITRVLHFLDALPFMGDPLVDGMDAKKARAVLAGSVEVVAEIKAQLDEWNRADAILPSASLMKSRLHSILAGKGQS